MHHVTFKYLQIMHRCRICQEIPEGSSVACEKGHMVCSACLEREGVLRQNFCPVCKIFYGLWVTERPSILNRQLACQFQIYGCHTKTPMRNWEAHTGICPFNPRNNYNIPAEEHDGVEDSEMLDILYQELNNRAQQRLVRQGRLSRFVIVAVIVLIAAIYFANK